MPARTAEAEWHGGLQDGNGSMSLGSGAFKGPYSFKSRMQDGAGTNPEELIGAAHAGCFTMALSAALEKAGHKAERVHTKATVEFGQQGGGFAITGIQLECEAVVPGIDEAAFKQQAESAKTNCPVSKALAAVPITLNARLMTQTAG